MTKKLNVIIAPASFKGTLEPDQAATAIAAAFADQQTHLLPLADGGEGSLHPLMQRFNCQLQETDTVNALGVPIKACYGLSADGIAVIESARTIGLTQITGSPDVMRAHSRGLGLLIKDAMQRGAREIWVGLGGSGVVDAGLGMMSELGFSFSNQANQAVLTAEHGVPVNIDVPIRPLKNVKMLALVDVKNLLLGEQGAQMYMAQKGASKSQTTELDQWLRGVARVFERQTGRRLRDQQGAGAAGGLGMAFDFLGAQIIQGGPFFADVAQLDELLEDADLLITGEGSLDVQTSFGKPVMVAIDRAISAGVPVVVLCGQWHGFKPPPKVSVFACSVWPGETPSACLTRSAKQVRQIIKSFMS